METNNPLTCSECGATPATWVSFNVGEDITRVCLCSDCIQQITVLGVAVKPSTPAN